MKRKKDEVLLLITKNTDRILEQTKTKLQETVKFKKTKPSETFSFDIPSKRGKNGYDV